MIMNSMNPKELDCKAPIDQSRLLRIARGAGVAPQEVEQLLAQHKQFEKLFSGMNKAGLLDGDDKTLAKKIQRNPSQMGNLLQSVMDPRILQQMGGTEAVMSMVKEMGGAVGLGGGAGSKKGKAGGATGLPGLGGLPGMGNPAMMAKMQQMMKSMGMG